MSDAFADAADFLNDALSGPLGGSAGTAVVYVRGLTRANWTATTGSTEWETESDPDTVSAWKSRDYIGAAADLTSQGIAMPPLAGDQVIEVIAGQTVTHELMDVNNGQPFRFSDSGEKRVRVHTKEISRV